MGAVNKKNSEVFGAVTKTDATVTLNYYHRSIFDEASDAESLIYAIITAVEPDALGKNEEDLIETKIMLMEGDETKIRPFYDVLTIQNSHFSLNRLFC